MGFNTAIPRGNNTPAYSALLMQKNFTRYNIVFRANHVAMNSTGQGKHANVILTNQSPTPGDPSVTVTWPTLFAKNSSTKGGTITALYSKIPVFLPAGFIDSGSVQNPSVQWTYNSVALTATTPSKTSSYQSFLFGGYLIYMNQTILTSAKTTITLTPAPTKILSVIAQPTSTDASVPYPCSVNVVTSNTFTIEGTVGITYQWIAIAQD